MSYLFHGLMIVIYAAAAAVAAKLLPAALPAVTDHIIGENFIEDSVALAYGTLALALFALVHAAYAGLRWRVGVGRELAGLRQSHGRVMREVGFARAEAKRIYETLEAAGRGGGAKAVREVVNEVKVLKGLIERLSESREAPAGGMEALSPPPAEEAPLPVAFQLDLDDDAILDIVRDGLKADRVELVLQAVVSLPQRKSRYFECFSRIGDAAGAIIVPEQYIAIAEREGLVTAIDNLLLFRCVQLVRRAQRANRGVGFFCNISPHTLADARFFRDFIAFMEENRDLAQALHFEFSQASIAEMSPEVADHLGQLRALGFQFSLDQTKRLDLRYDEVSRRGFRFIKVDARTILAYIAAAGEGGGFDALKDTLERNAIDLIVDKIEDEATLVELLDHGIDYGQGFLFGEPRPARLAPDAD